VAYAGSKGTKLAERAAVNQAVLVNPAAPLSSTARRPFPNFGDVESTNWQENSSYNALQTRFERRFSGGVNFLGAYTWSHSIDTASRGSGGSVHQNSYALRADRASSDFDVRHRLSASLVYDLPFGRNKRFLSSLGTIGNRIVGGWSVNIISAFMTGNYYSVTVAGDRANVGSGVIERANRSCDGNLPHSDRTIYRYFNTSCFSVTPLGTFGNSGRNVVQVPGLNNWDISFGKETVVTERARVQFRGEMFNIFNHPQFQTPDLTAGDVTFGEITTAYAPRIVQLALKLLW
jgi:hypothetical protein